MSGLYTRLRMRSVARCADWLPPHGPVVDLGAGTGALLRVLRRRREPDGLVAVEHDPARVARMRADPHLAGVEILEADLRQVPPRPVQAVACVDVLHYLPAAEQETLLLRWSQALLPGGVFLLRDPDAGARVRFAITRVHERVMTTVGPTRARVEHYRSASAWQAALEAVGLAARVVHRARGPYADVTLLGRKEGVS